MAHNDPVLKVVDLSLSYLTRHGTVRAVRGVSFELARGQSLGLVGESGCGKTSIANCLLRLLPDNGRLTSGQVLLDGRDLLQLPEEEMRQFRWRRMAMVFQAAMNSLDPVYRVGQQVVEAIEAHRVESDGRRRQGAGGSPVPHGGTRSSIDATISPRVQRRNAAASGDRDGVGLRPRRDHRR